MVVLLSACELRADLGVTVGRDGAGELVVTLDVDEELAAAAAAADIDPFADVVEAAAAAADSWSAARAGEGVTLRTAFDSPAALTQRSARLAAELDAAELRPLEPLHVEVDDDRITFRGGAALMPTAAVDELGYPVDEAAAVLSDAVTYQVGVTMPGEILEASAGGRVAERTVTWEVPAGGRVDLRAVAVRPPPAPAWRWWVVGAGTALLAGVGAWVVVALRR